MRITETKRYTKGVPQAGTLYLLDSKNPMTLEGRIEFIAFGKMAMNGVAIAGKQLVNGLIQLTAYGIRSGVLITKTEPQLRLGPADWEPLEDPVDLAEDVHMTRFREMAQALGLKFHDDAEGQFDGPEEEWDDPEMPLDTDSLVEESEPEEALTAAEEDLDPAPEEPVES